MGTSTTPTKVLGLRARGRSYAGRLALMLRVARWTFRAMDLRQYSMSAAQPGLSVEFVENLEARFHPWKRSGASPDTLPRRRRS